VSVRRLDQTFAAQAKALLSMKAFFVLALGRFQFERSFIQVARDGIECA
jgi:hypothetical protein